jgi:hypothetical protein
MIRPITAPRADASTVGMSAKARFAKSSNSEVIDLGSSTAADIRPPIDPAGCPVGLCRSVPGFSPGIITVCYQTITRGYTLRPAQVRPTTTRPADLAILPVSIAWLPLLRTGNWFRLEHVIRQNHDSMAIPGWPRADCSGSRTRSGYHLGSKWPCCTAYRDARGRSGTSRLLGQTCLIPCFRRAPARAGRNQARPGWPPRRVRPGHADPAARS